MTALRALIVDDERLARKELRRLLTQHPEIEIAGEAANAQEARRAIAELEPELLFLDVQMPGESGFDLLASLAAAPTVVFTTAYDEFALRAFEVSALDYLVKPIEPERLAQTVRRLLARPTHTAGSGEDHKTGNHLLLVEHDRVFVTDGERCWLVPLGDIRLFESVGNYSRAYFGSETPLINRSLRDLESKLDDRIFFRANRHQIVNLKAVRSIRPWFGERLLAELEGGHEVTLSRRRSRAFRERLSV
ncbi:MAG TPA: response regulator [Longimicrobiales bacterium]|nr:response regulator [Longimicrobiales bacterium]